MSLLHLHIQTGDGERGRSFSGVVLACASARGISDLGDPNDTIRPVMLMVATSPGEARALTENLRAGHKARLRGPRTSSKGTPLEFLRSAGYAFPPPQIAGKQVVITAYLPNLFRFHPGIVDDPAKVVLMPAFADLDALYAPEDVPAVAAHLRALGLAQEAEAVEGDPRRIGMAVMFSRYLGQRCEYPIPFETTFAVQLYHALRSGPSPVVAESSDLFGHSYGSGPGETARYRIGFRSYVAPGLAMHSGVAVLADQARLGKVLAAETLAFDRAKKGHVVRARAGRKLEAA